MAVDYTYTINDRQMIAMFHRLEKKGAKYIKLAIADSVREVALRSTGEFMIPRPGPHGDKIGVRTSRLLRSVQAGFSFAQGASGSQESIRELKITKNNFIARFGSKVPYAAIHEFGGVIPPKFVKPIRAKALSWIDPASGERRFSRGHMVGAKNVPPRPFLGPALDASELKIYDFFRLRMEQLIQDVTGGN
jgi:phage gpG-like protein